jgi:membrane fusion protein (multidrug efflux system)
MKRIIYLLITTVVLASCGEKKTVNKTEELIKLKKERVALDAKIQKMEAEVSVGQPQKATPVSVLEVAPAKFDAYVEVQAQVNGDQDVMANAQALGTITSIRVQSGQRVGRGQVLATLDASALDQQIRAMDPTINLQRSLYEKQQKLWAQNIGTEVQLMSAKANYEASTRQRSALQAQRDMYTIKSPISGVVDQVNAKVGDAAGPGSQNGIRVVSFDKLKATATLGENYLGKVKQGDPVYLIFGDALDTMHSRLSYVSKAVDPISRSFNVEVKLPGNTKLHPNMSCKMRIANYMKSSAITVPVSVIQKTADGDLLYIAEGNKAKAVFVTTGKNSNGQVEILSGLNAGDKVITEGYEGLDNGEAVAITKL